MRVAIVDDEVVEQRKLAEYFRRIQKELKEKIDLRCFSSGEEFLEMEDAAYDLICLDIDLQGKDGIQTAREIRAKDKQVLIIFITNMAQMAIRGYEVQAFDFILKPINYYSFSMKIQNIANIIHNTVKVRNIVVETKTGIQRITTDELYYIEVEGHYLFYHTKSGIMKKKTSMKEAEKELASAFFHRCNNCYLVNLKHVVCVEKDDVKVGDSWLKISRPRKKDFLQALANYMGGFNA